MADFDFEYRDSSWACPLFPLMLLREMEKVKVVGEAPSSFAHELERELKSKRLDGNVSWPPFL